MLIYVVDNEFMFHLNPIVSCFLSLMSISLRNAVKYVWMYKNRQNETFAIIQASSSGY